VFTDTCVFLCDDIRGLFLEIFNQTEREISEQLRDGEVLVVFVSFRVLSISADAEIEIDEERVFFAVVEAE